MPFNVIKLASHKWPLKELQFIKLERLHLLEVLLIVLNQSQCWHTKSISPT